MDEKKEVQTKPKAKPEPKEKAVPEKSKKGKCKACRHWVMKSLAKAGQGECLYPAEGFKNKKRSASDSCEHFDAF